MREQIFKIKQEAAMAAVQLLNKNKQYVYVSWKFSDGKFVGSFPTWGLFFNGVFMCPLLFVLYLFCLSLSTPALSHVSKTFTCLIEALFTPLWSLPVQWALVYCVLGFTAVLCERTDISADLPFVISVLQQRTKLVSLNAVYYK